MSTRRPLDATEITDAAMTAALIMALQTVGRLMAAGSFFQVFSTLSVSVLAARHRPRVVASAIIPAVGLTLVLGGIGPISHSVIAGLMGYANGTAIARRYGLLRHVGRTLLVAWPVISAVTLGLLWVLADFRELTLENARNNIDGAAAIMGAAGIPTDTVTDGVHWTIDHWWLFVPMAQAVITIAYALIIRRLGRFVIDRVDRALGDGRHHYPIPVPATGAPVPLALDNVRIQRGARSIALDIDTTIGPGDAVTLEGPNGIGKTSLLDAVAGLVPAEGVGHDAAALGAAGGTAFIGQRPETQVVGVRVVDDVLWGAPPGTDPGPALEIVGLAHNLTQPTSELSGGELQRLAVAAALVRRPSLLLSDESTAMLDPAGRRAVIDLLLTTARQGTAVVHSTHLDEDLEAFDRTVRLGGDTGERAEHRWATPPRPDSEPLLEARGAGYVHNARTPWEHRVLEGIDFAVGRGQLAVVRGTNGSGKTTLARMLAGIVAPSEGTISLGDKPLDGPHRRIGIAFQHARLQLLRPRLREEVVSLAGRDDVDEAIEALGFSVADDGDRRIDELSGGQQRRVLLAGLIARQCDVMILDEPLAGLDRAGRLTLTRAIDEQLRRGVAVVAVSHDPAWALERADSVLDLDAAAIGAVR